MRPCGGLRGIGASAPPRRSDPPQAAARKCNNPGYCRNATAATCCISLLRRRSGQATQRKAQSRSRGGLEPRFREISRRAARTLQRRPPGRRCGGPQPRAAREPGRENPGPPDFHGRAGRPEIPEMPENPDLRRGGAGLGNSPRKDCRCRDLWCVTSSQV